MALTWTTKKIAQTLNLPTTGSDLPIQSITTDSRKVSKGSLFVAIKGDTHDGHDFIAQAFQAGAVAVLSEKDAGGGTVFKVPSAMDAIRKIAHVYRKSFDIPMIAVVGAVGKTTTKELLASILSGRFKNVHKTDGSENGFLGIPLTLLKLNSTHDIAVIEIGIDEIGAMEKHLALVEPTHVILTKNGPEHLHQLKTVEIAANEECKALDYAFKLELPMALNLSDEYVAKWHKTHLKKLREGGEFVTYSLNPADKPELLGKYDGAKNTLSISAEERAIEFISPLPGEHHAHNLLAAFALTSFFLLSQKEVKAGLATFKTAYGRTEMYTLKNGATVIGDYYNSNPTSLAAAIDLLGSVKGAKQYHAVLGDMLELGDDEEKFHRSAARVIASSPITHVWLYGERMRWLFDELKVTAKVSVQHFTSHEELFSSLKNTVDQSARILIKGSRGMRMEKVLKPLIESQLTS